VSSKLISKSIVVTVLAITPPLAAAPQSSDVLAAYAIDSDTFELVRYSFAGDSFLSIGPVRTASGVVVKDCESLGYVPPGAGFGMYSVPTAAPYKNQLIRIDPLTAEATVVGPVAVPVGRKITGMLSAYDSVAKVWYLLAASSEDKASGQDQIETRELVRFNPLTGASTIVATQAQLGNGRRFEGLGMDSNGDIYATGRTRFYRIHQEAGYWVQELGITGLDKAETFEVAFGDAQPPLSVPGVNQSWTTHGVFFVADEQLQKFGVLNPANGAFAEYLVSGLPSTFVTKDAEGMVLLTLSNDPLYGMFIAFD
jgi:hypothetical protein